MDRAEYTYARKRRLRSTEIDNIVPRFVDALLFFFPPPQPPDRRRAASQLLSATTTRMQQKHLASIYIYNMLLICS